MSFCVVTAHKLIYKFYTYKVLHIISHSVTADHAQIVGFWLMTLAVCFVKIRIVVKLQYFNNTSYKMEAAVMEIMHKNGALN